MNYNDDGIIKQITVKAGDTLPVGTEVDFDGTTIPAGWEEIDNTYTLTPAYTHTSNNYQAFRNGNVVTINGQFILPSITANTFTQLFSVPNELYPSVYVQTPITIRDGNNGQNVGYGAGILNSSGNFSITSNVSLSGLTIVYLNMTYLIN